MDGPITCKCGAEIDPLTARCTIATSACAEIVIECDHCGLRYSAWVEPDWLASQMNSDKD